MTKRFTLNVQITVTDETKAMARAAAKAAAEGVDSPDNLRDAVCFLIDDDEPPADHGWAWEGIEVVDEEVWT